MNTLSQIQASFNGELSDYLLTLKDTEVQKEIFESYRAFNLKILVDYRFSIHHELISNQIIRYKDIQKIPENSFHVPYILYGMNAKDETFALVLTREDYLHAKGLYLALTEPKGLLESYKNQCIASNLNHPENKHSLEELMAGQVSAGSLQRRLDKEIYHQHEGLIELSTQKAITLQSTLKEILPTTQAKEPLITHAVIHWFLLKKMVYVHTMMNRNLLNGPCKGDVKQQRHLAKQNADSIQFMMYSEMWRL